ncbi:FG-GAP-like repeat-containing protein [Synoicihabitans lomoniglobus]|uniref:FG-GAP-like repeat-containing protein n=2 Tax=Synoicihabitans lomoniglobus TaxID=2909285 RepID=A0AAE9ZXS4_9BACT|nr:FG-GAP-like repeat-containing protein [Opitutaceae bacterium LMO-M01]
MRFFLLVGLILATAASGQPTPPTQAFVADVTSAPLRSTDGSGFAPGDTLTMEGWFYVTAPQPYAWIMGRGLAAAGNDPYVSCALLLDDQGQRPVFSYSTGVTGSFRQINSPVDFPLNTWVHLAAVIAGDTSRLYQNGVEVASGSVNGAPPVEPQVPFSVGVAYLANGDTNYARLKGFARQIRFWSVARTTAQINAALGESLPSDRNGLVAAWPLDESTGTTAADISGQNHSLTSGGTWARSTVIEHGPFFALARSPLPPAESDDLGDAIAIDFDHDGDADFITTHSAYPATYPETRRRLRAYRNDGGTFHEVTDAVLGNVTMTVARHWWVGDLTGDAIDDLLIVGHGTDIPPFPGEQSQLLVGTADGRLRDETATRLPAHIGFTHNVAVGDIDGDGDPDLYLANIGGGTGGPRIYLNDGAGNFTNAPNRLPADIANRAAGSVYTSSLLLDLNADGVVDLLLGGDQTASNEVLINDGTGTFARDSRFVLPPKHLEPTAVVVAITSGDLNGDGAPDLILSETGGSATLSDGTVISGYAYPGVQLLLNRGDGTFYDASDRLNLTFDPIDQWIVWVRLADLDRDGRLDLVFQGAYTSTGAPFTRTILLNRGAATFVDASEAYPGAFEQSLHAFDADGDGWIDLVGVNSQSIDVFRSTGNLQLTPFLTTAENPGRLVNLSVRTRAGTGDDTLTAGFALSGNGTTPLLVRAIGPTLSEFGVPGVLTDPAVQIAPLGGATVATNDNWGGTTDLRTAFSSVGAFPLAADTSADAAVVFEPGAGPYTAQVTRGGGVALVEVYALDATAETRLVNLSARTRVGTGADVLVAGFSVNGNVPRKLLIRAVGPTLGTYGVGGTLADPVLSIIPLGSSTPVATNDNWGGSPALSAAFARTGAFALSSATSLDAALVIELPPGGYTAVVSGQNQSTGIALVEVYEVP